MDWPTFGVELELHVPGMSIDDVAYYLTMGGLPCDCTTPQGRDDSRWAVVLDASVGTYEGEALPHIMWGGEPDPVALYLGMEVDSPILRGDLGRWQLNRALLLLRKLEAVTTEECGLHVHHGADILDLEAWKRLCSFYLENERTIDRLVSPSRRENGNRHCPTCRVFDLEDIESCQNLEEVLFVFDAKAKLNPTAYYDHGTVEFRHQGGTLDAADVMNWVALTRAMVESAVLNTPPMRRLPREPLRRLFAELSVPRSVRSHYYRKLKEEGQ